MLQCPYNKLTALFLQKIPMCSLILCSVSLTACSLYTHGPGGSLHLFDLITGKPRKVAAIIVYAILFSAVLTIPLNMAKCFQNPKTYKLYKLFWWLASLIFAYLLLLLNNVAMNFSRGYISESIMHYFIVVMLILIPTLTPAAYQYNTNKGVITKWALILIILLPFIYISYWVYTVNS
ncbi:MAG: hypothetical protein HOP02_11835 [Methylococcaceae bacterium]|nr:hypothetical protein [Methylococcaceae bacterium]